MAITNLFHKVRYSAVRIDNDGSEIGFLWLDTYQEAEQHGLTMLASGSWLSFVIEKRYFREDAI